MGIKEKLFGRGQDDEFRRIQTQEREKQFRKLRADEARKKGQAQATYLAQGGFFGAFGRAVQQTAKGGGAYAKRKMIDYAKTAKKDKKKKVDFMAPLRPMGMDAGYGTQPNINNVMPDFLQKKKKR